MSDTRHAILEQLATGALSVEEAAIQLNALRDAPETPTATPPVLAAEPALKDEAPGVDDLKADAPATKPSAEPRRLRILVTDHATNQHRVQISLPLGWVRFGLELGEKWGARSAGFAWQDLRAALEQDGGVLMDVDDADQHVEIRID